LVQNEIKRNKISNMNKN